MENQRGFRQQWSSRESHPRFRGRGQSQPHEQGLFGPGPGPTHGYRRLPMQMQPPQIQMHAQIPMLPQLQMPMRPGVQPPIRPFMQALMGPPPQNPQNTSFIEPYLERDRSFTVQDYEDSKRKEMKEALKKMPTRDISDEDLAAEMKRILPSPQNGTLMGNIFPPYTALDDPDARKVKCRKPLPCGHLCQDPLILNKSPCGFCRFVKDFIKPCGHTTVIFCGRNESLVPCKKICDNVLLCEHTCPNVCHFGTPCEKHCESVYCKAAVLGMDIGTYLANNQSSDDGPPPAFNWDC